MFVFCGTFEKKVQASWNLHHVVQMNTLYMVQKKSADGSHFLKSLICVLGGVKGNLKYWQTPV